MAIGTEVILLPSATYIIPVENSICGGLGLKKAQQTWSPGST